MLARQAASIELGLSGQGSEESILPATFARVIIGTTGEARSEASTALVAGVAVIGVSGGLMEFLYQARPGSIRAARGHRTLRCPRRREAGPCH